MDKGQRMFLVDKMIKLLRFTKGDAEISKASTERITQWPRNRECFLVDKLSKLLRFTKGVPEIPKTSIERNSQRQMT